MSIVKKLVILLGGTIDVESAPGKGTKVCVSITYKVSNEKPETEIVSNKTDKIDFQGKRILLAEDNDLNAEISMAILEELGIQTDRAVNGLDCLEKLGKQPAYYYDLILMDIQMPVLNGFDATKLIRKMEDPEKCDIPVIAMTANAFEQDKKNSVAAGMNGHLAKPIELSKLLKVLSEYLS